MLSRFRQNILGQVLLLALFAALAAAVEYFGAYHPPLRLSSRNVLRGLVGGLFAFLAVWTLQMLMLRFSPVRFRRSLAAEREAALKQSLPARIGGSISTAAGEEFFLRGYAFGYLMWDSFWAALALNVLLVAALNYRGRAHLLWTAARTCEGVFYCMLFYAQHSLALNAAARFTESLLSMALLRSRLAGSVLETAKFSWRIFYDKANTGSRVSYRV